MSKVAALEYAARRLARQRRRHRQLRLPGLGRDAADRTADRGARRAGSGDREQGVRALLGEKQPSVRMSLPAEIAELVLWLCRPAAHNLTGAAIPVDGGWTAQ